MRASTPRDSLAATPDVVELAQPLYRVGTRVDLSKVKVYNQAYLKKKVRRTIIRRLRATLNSLQAQGFLKDMRGKKMLDGNKENLREIFNLMETADSVEVAGHAPQGMHVVGAVANQCYLCDGQVSGMRYRYYLLFRKTDAEGRKLVYIYPESILDESTVSACVIQD